MSEEQRPARASFSSKSCSESGGSVTRAKCRLRSRLAKYRISRSRTASRTCFSEVSRIGIATSVLHSSGIPAEIQPGQPLRFEEMRHQQIRHGDGAFHHRNQGNHQNDGELPRRWRGPNPASTAANIPQVANAIVER